MSEDDPGKGFASWRSYWDFHREIARDWRYIRSPAAQRFLDRLCQESHSRITVIHAGRNFYRAQVAHHDELDPAIEDIVPAPALPGRMKPFADRASEGRVNPKGTPCLYMAADRRRALAECRPWIGSLVSIGVFRTERDLRVVDCTREVERSPIFLKGEPSLEERSKAVWTHLAKAFRQPVTREGNIAEYAPTQVIAETFRAQGFDGVAYRSAFGTDRFNVALFDLNAASLVMCELHEIKDVNSSTARPPIRTTSIATWPAAGFVDGELS
jgi:hypothetical protein